MSLITVSSLSKSFGAFDLFSAITFAVARGARLALVGPNGVGKTTLLRILVGEDEASSGKVSRSKGVRIGYLPQEADFEMTGTLWEACLAVFSELIQRQEELHRLEVQMADAAHASSVMQRYGKLQEDFERRGGYIYVTRIKQVLTGLGFTESDYDMSLDHLSGGQRTRAYLARLLLSNPDLLLSLNSSKITSSMRLPVSIRAVAMMVSEPPSSILRAAPKNRFGRCSAFASTPPVSTLPEDG